MTRDDTARWPMTRVGPPSFLRVSTNCGQPATTCRPESLIRTKGNRPKSNQLPGVSPARHAEAASDLVACATLSVANDASLQQAIPPEGAGAARRARRRLQAKDYSTYRWSSFSAFRLKQARQGLQSQRSTPLIPIGNCLRFVLGHTGGSGGYAR